MAPSPHRRRILLGTLAAVAVAIALLAGADRYITRQYRAKCYRDLSQLPSRETALLLGTGKYLAGGGENPMYRYRIEAAARLWRSGKVDYILASGDNGHAGYDEPSQMTIDLVDLGVPFDAIYRDYAGFRTLDSIVRARKVFGLKECIIVSQPFHNERALFLATALGLDAIAFDAADVPFAFALKTRAREKFARVAAILDVHLFHTQPKFLGPRLDVGQTPPA